MVTWVATRKPERPTPVAALTADAVRIAALPARETAQAGHSPTIIETRALTVVAKRMAVGPTTIRAAGSETAGGTFDRSSGSAYVTTSSARLTAASVTSSVSASRRLTSRHRPAPSAWRTAISRIR